MIQLGAVVIQLGAVVIQPRCGGYTARCCGDTARYWQFCYSMGCKLLKEAWELGQESVFALMF